MYDWATKQLRKRSEILSKSTRSEEEINYLGNKGAWIRVVSSVNLEASFLKYFKDQYSIDLDETGLAKNFILFGGTSTYASGLRYGINQGPTYTSGGSYGLLGSKEVKEYGYRPMPGITSMTIESTGRMGSLRQATVNFRVSDKMQLDVMDALYFRPGFSVLIEYAHAKYINNKGELESTEELMIEPFKTTDKEKIGIKISRNIRKSAGNYGGLLSIITSFNFSMTPDGGYDCVLKTIALGGVMGNYPINKLEALPAIYIKQLKAFLDKQRKEKEAAERAAAEAAAKEEIGKLPNAPNDNWNSLKIEDPLSNLIYNINPEVFSSAIDKITKLDAGKKYIEYNKIKVEEATVQYAKVNFIAKQDFKNVEMISISSGLGSAIFIKNTFQTPAEGKYITNVKLLPQQKGDITVQINPNRIFNVLSAGVTTDQVIDERIKRLKFINWFDIVDDADQDFLFRFFDAVANISDVELSVRTYKVKPNDDAPEYEYAIGIEYPEKKKTEARALFLDEKTRWTVLSMGGGLDSTQILLETITDDGTFKLYLGYSPPTRGGRAEPPKIYSGDLSFISNVIEEGTNQDLAKNKIVEQVNKIEERVKTQIQDINNRYEIETEAKTLQALASSQSAIELMLRSISLYAISQQKPDVVLSDKFIKDLFSEGAYSKIFKKISGGKLPTRKYELGDFARYIDGTMNASDRLEVNLRYGNSAYLMSAENASEDINLLEKIPQVEFANLFKVKQIPYGVEKADVYVADAPDVSIYISLGLFLLMLNHCSMLYNTGKQDDTIVPMTYIDFNPSTNYYLSSINQFSIDPFSFIMPYYGNDNQYKKLFKPSIINSNNQIELKVSGSSIQPHSIFKFSNDKLSRGLLNNKVGLSGGNSDGYIGRTMDTLINVNFLLRIIKDYSTSSDYGETYFQSILENITATLNKSTGYYNAFRLSYSDSANAYMIIDDQIQLKPDPIVQSLQYDIIKNTSSPEIPIQGKGSIARSFELRTDISNRISSMLAISTNAGSGTQVGIGKNMGDFGVYNTGSYDRYMPVKISESSSIAPQNNVQECQAAINFDTIVTTIYGLSRNQNKETITPQQVQNAMAYYRDRMARVKNEQPQSVSAMIIPIRTTITMDGFSGIYPFQLFTINENVLPYRYSSVNLNRGKVGFTTTKITHNFSNNEWITSMDGLMTFLKNPTDEQVTKNITPGPIEVNIISGAPIIFTSIVANSKEIYDFFIAQGFTNFQAAAWVGNLNQESGLDPTTVNRKGAIGIAQWLYPSRKNALITRPGYNTLQVQLDYIMEELNSAEFSGIYNEIKATTNITDATLVIRTEYEKPGESEADDARRLAYAEFIFEKFNKV